MCSRPRGLSRAGYGRRLRESSLTSLWVDHHKDSPFSLLLCNHLSGSKKMRFDLFITPNMWYSFRIGCWRIVLCHLSPQRQCVRAFQIVDELCSGVGTTGCSLDGIAICLPNRQAIGMAVGGSLSHHFHCRRNATSLTYLVYTVSIEAAISKK